MKKNSTARQAKGESPYAKGQRHRAEKIIAATGCYSAAFRNEVQRALDHLPHKLPLLFRDADRMNERLEEAGRAIRSSMRKAGLPIGEPTQRSPKPTAVRMAEEVESLFIQHENDLLDEAMAERADLISDILFDIGNESGVNATHPRLVKAYLLAIQDALPSIETQRDYDAVIRAFKQVRDLMNGCSRARFEQIDTIYHGDPEETYQARRAEAGDKTEEVAPAGVEADEPNEIEGLSALREKLAKLERLPENEAISFQLESEIYRLEHESDTDEWPDVIGEKGDSHDN